MRKAPFPHPGGILLEEFLKPVEMTQCGITGFPKHPQDVLSPTLKA